MKPVVLCDVDGVIADLLATWLVKLFIRHGVRVWPEEVVHWDMHKAYPTLAKEQVYDVLRDPYLYDSVGPIKYALEGVRELRRQGFRVVFLTSCVEGSLDQKVGWLKRHKFLPNERAPRDLVIARDKSLVQGMCLIDDAIHNVSAFPGPTVLVAAAHNESEDHPRRALDWTEIVDHVNEISANRLHVVGTTSDR